MAATSNQPTSSTTNPPAGQEKSKGEPVALTENDLARLAQKIYQLMQRELRLDRERRIRL